MSEIVRLWRGWTDPADADDYEAFLAEGPDSPLAGFDAEGYLGYELLRRVDGEGNEAEVEFTTVIRFADYDAVRAFAGGEYEAAHVPPEARELLSRWDDEARHYERRAGERVA